MPKISAVGFNENSSIRYFAVKNVQTKNKCDRSIRFLADTLIKQKIDYFLRFISSGSNCFAFFIDFARNSVIFNQAYDLLWKLKVWENLKEPPSCS